MSGNSSIALSCSVYNLFADEDNVATKKKTTKKSLHATVTKKDAPAAKAAPKKAVDKKKTEDTKKPAKKTKKEEKEESESSEDEKPKKKQKKETKEKKEKKAKDPDAPKRGKSGYLIFSMENRECIKKANPKASNTEMTKLIAAEWKKLSDKEKKVPRISF